MDEWEFHRTLDVNLGGAYFCTQLAGRLMREHGGGVILNLVSLRKQANARKGCSAYLASQAGLLGLTQAVAGELSTYHIRLNALCYGPTDKGLIISHEHKAAGLQPWQASHPAARLGDHPELISLVLYLCSEAARSITGRVLFSRLENQVK